MKNTLKKKDRFRIRTRKCKGTIGSKTPNIHHLSRVLLYLKENPNSNKSKIAREGLGMGASYVRGALQWLKGQGIVLELWVPRGSDRGRSKMQAYSLNPRFEFLRMEAKKNV